MESIFTELALYRSKIECARTDNVFYPISEVRNGTVSLVKSSFCWVGLTVYWEMINDVH